MRKVFKYLLLYLGVILFFGTFYYGYWYIQPDSFIIDERLNLRPFSSQEILGEYEAYDLTYYQRKADSLRLAEIKHKDMSENFRHQVDSLTPLVKSIYGQHEDARADNIQRWKDEQIPDSLKIKLEGVKMALESIGESDGNELMRAQLNISRTRLELEIATINVESSQYVLDNYGDFVDSTLRNQFTRVDSTFNALTLRLIPNNELDIRRIDFELIDLKFSALRMISKRVDFLDFLLFSAANSSTVTYGGIVPNDRFVRFLLVLQAVSCIVLIAIATDSLIGDGRNKGGK